MGKIQKKLNGVFFESSLDTSAWFILGVFITLLLMITLMAVGFGDMIGGMLLQGINGLMALLVPSLQNWGNVEIDYVGDLFPADVNRTVTMAVCLVIAIAIIGIFTFLQVWKPEKMRTRKECARF